MQVDTHNKEFQDALNLIQYTRQSVFLTGKAGTGKSTFLKYVCEVTKKKHIVLAPTGIAAINAGGSTLHSFFKLPFYPLLPDDPKFSLKDGKLHSFLRYTSAHRKLIKEIELVIIDEISMVRADIIDFIDKILRVYSQNMREPFGGKQILLVGDIFQLEPVIKNDEREIINRFYPTPYFFSARVFQEMELVSIELTKVYRQSDKVFVNVLDHIRTNTAGAADLQLLNTRYNTQIEENESDMYITLATRRDTVDFINEKKLSELPGESTILTGEIHGEFPESSRYYFADKKEGAINEIKKHCSSKTHAIEVAEIKPKRSIKMIDLSEAGLSKRNNFIDYIRLAASNNSGKIKKEYLLPNFVAACCREAGIEGIKYYSSSYNCYVTWQDDYFSFVDFDVVDI